MPCRLLNLLTALSLLLCVAAVALWERSQWRRDKVAFGHGVTFVGAESSGGEFGLYWDTDASPVVTAAWRGPHAGGFRATSVESMGGVADLVSIGRWAELGIGLDDYDILHAFAIRGGNASTHRRVVTVPYA